jgi:hypothetical protein
MTSIIIIIIITIKMKIKCDRTLKILNTFFKRHLYHRVLPFFIMHDYESK